MEFPHSEASGSKRFPVPRNISLVVTSFVASGYQGILRWLFNTLDVKKIDVLKKLEKITIT